MVIQKYLVGLPSILLDAMAAVAMGRYQLGFATQKRQYDESGESEHHQERIR